MQLGSARPRPGAVATVGVDERVAFLRKTYGHLAAAIGGFVLVSYLLHGTAFALDMTRWTMSGRYNFLLLLGAFMAVGWVAEKWASSDTSRGVQYVGLGLYVVAEALIFVPLLYIAANHTDASIIPNAAALTLLLFAGLTGTVFITKKDFSFIGNGLRLATFAAFAVILAGILFGFSLGLFFSFLMVGLCAGYVLYYTSFVLAHCRPTQYVAASLLLFSAIAMMFWYILQIFMSLGRD